MKVKVHTKFILFLWLMLAGGVACSNENNENSSLLMETDLGNVTIKLYDDTPEHRDNIIKLAKKGYYDGVLFHRVINDFMVQTGDPNSKEAKAGARLGNGGPNYTIPAEIIYPKYIHKRGAVCAARMGDDVNPEKRSSGSQFYIVTGRLFNEDAMNLLQMGRKNKACEVVFSELMRKHRDEFLKMNQENDSIGMIVLRDTLVAQTERMVNPKDYQFTPEELKAYTTVGGAPHLDGEYTVFGEVTEGMDVIEQIEQTETGEFDRPLKDIRIKKITVLKNK